MMGQLGPSFGYHDRSWSLNSKAYDDNQINRFSIISSPGNPHPQLPKNRHRRGSSFKLQSRESPSLTLPSTNGLISQPRQPDLANQVISGLEPQADCASKCLVPEVPSPAQGSFGVVSTDIHGWGDSLAVREAKLAQTQRSSKRITTPEECPPRKARKHSHASPIVVAPSSSHVSKRTLSPASRDERKAAQSAAHTAKEQRRRLENSRALEGIAKLLGFEGTKVEILQKTEKWIKRNTKANEAIANLIGVGVDGSDVEVFFESLKKWILHAKSREAEQEARVAKLEARASFQAREIGFTSASEHRPSSSNAADGRLGV
ncbi:MAG: hypothetical protein L6R39_000812 [Caloplaca ligustica]|nr:MAG: hypothetical protein L6R39_000812 [Caloplaca ligustica]